MCMQLATQCSLKATTTNCNNYWLHLQKLCMRACAYVVFISFAQGFQFTPDTWTGCGNQRWRRLW